MDDQRVVWWAQVQARDQLGDFLVINRACRAGVYTLSYKPAIRRSRKLGRHLPTVAREFRPDGNGLLSSSAALRRILRARAAGNEQLGRTMPPSKAAATTCMTNARFQWHRGLDGLKFCEQ
jgi:hypothetical protein